jgi:hypothetical protein
MRLQAEASDSHKKINSLQADNFALRNRLYAHSLLTPSSPPYLFFYRLACTTPQAALPVSSISQPPSASGTSSSSADVSTPSIFTTQRLVEYNKLMSRKSSDYPYVQFFSEDLYTLKGSANADLALPSDRNGPGARSGRSSRNQRLTFLEDKDGEPVDAGTENIIKKTAADLFNSLSTEMRGNIPSTTPRWSHEMKAYFVVELCAAAPQVGYCSNGWKALRIAKVLYPEIVRNKRKAGELPPAKDNKKRGAVRPSKIESQHEEDWYLGT